MNVISQKIVSYLLCGGEDIDRIQNCNKCEYNNMFIV